MQVSLQLSASGREPKKYNFTGLKETAGLSGLTNVHLYKETFLNEIPDYETTVENYPDIHTTAAFLEPYIKMLEVLNSTKQTGGLGSTHWNLEMEFKI